MLSLIWGNAQHPLLLWDSKVAGASPDSNFTLRQPQEMPDRLHLLANTFVITEEDESIAFPLQDFHLAVNDGALHPSPRLLMCVRRDERSL